MESKHDKKGSRRLLQSSVEDEEKRRMAGRRMDTVRWMKRQNQRQRQGDTEEGT